MSPCGPEAKSAERVATSALAPQSGLAMLTVSSSPFDPNRTSAARHRRVLLGSPARASTAEVQKCAAWCTIWLSPIEPREKPWTEKKPSGGCVRRE